MCTYMCMYIKITYTHIKLFLILDMAYIIYYIIYTAYFIYFFFFNLSPNYTHSCIFANCTNKDHAAQEK